MAEPTTETPITDGAGPWTPWKRRIDASKKRRDEKLAEWQENVDARRGSSSTSSHIYDRISTHTDNRVSVNQDWPLTKAKIAQLYSQTPEVRLTPKFPEFQQAVPAFGRELNTVIAEANVGAVIEECLSDII